MTGKGFAGTGQKQPLLTDNQCEAMKSREPRAFA
jgi:hypothetical protein